MDPLDPTRARIELVDLVVARVGHPHLPVTERYAARLSAQVDDPGNACVKSVDPPDPGQGRCSLAVYRGPNGVPRSCEGAGDGPDRLRSRFHGSDVDVRPDRAADRVDFDELARSADRRPYAPVCGGDRGGVGADDEVAVHTAVAVGADPGEARDTRPYPPPLALPTPPLPPPPPLPPTTPA